jgi:hypothetical protein
MLNDILNSDFYRLTFAYLEQLEPDEREWACAFLSEMRLAFERDSIQVTPLIITRLDIVIREYLTIRKPVGTTTEASANSADPQEKGKRATSTAASEANGKARDRFRKAVSELEDSCVPLKKPVVGLADRLRPLILDARRVAEKAAANAATSVDAEEDSEE